MKRYYRYFNGFLDTQEKWLNKMAHKGLRLIGTGKLYYDFEPCTADEYQYCVEFTAHRSYKNEQDYRRFLEDLGYHVFYKNINWNYSIGKVTFRPYGHGKGKIATKPGNYDKELFIIEKKNDGQPFVLHTLFSDKAAYYKPVRNAWLSLSLLSLFCSIYSLIRIGVHSKEFIIFLISGMAAFVPVYLYHKQIRSFLRKAEIEE
jgi:hypothetical protein